MRPLSTTPSDRFSNSYRPDAPFSRPVSHHLTEACQVLALGCPVESLEARHLSPSTKAGSLTHTAETLRTHRARSPKTLFDLETDVPMLGTHLQTSLEGRTVSDYGHPIPLYPFSPSELVQYTLLLWRRIADPP